METFNYLIGQDADPISWWQMSVRALIIVFYALILFRVGLRKLLTGGAVLDIVIMVVIGSSLSRALTGNAPLLATLAATLALVALHLLLSALARQSETLSFLIKGRALRLVNDGEIVWAHMNKTQMGERDLREKLRLKGIDRLDDVDEAMLERNGEISVFKSGPTGREKIGDRD